MEKFQNEIAFAPRLAGFEPIDGRMRFRSEIFSKSWTKFRTNFIAALSLAGFQPIDGRMRFRSDFFPSLLRIGIKGKKFSERISSTRFHWLDFSQSTAECVFVLIFFRRLVAHHIKAHFGCRETLFLIRYESKKPTNLSSCLDVEKEEKSRESPSPAHLVPDFSSPSDVSIVC